MRRQLDDLITSTRSKVTLLPPTSESELEALERRLRGRVPAEIRDLLQYTQGLRCRDWDLPEIKFTGMGRFQVETVLPVSVDLAADGFGNFFAADVTSHGWGPVVFVSHDPCALVIRAATVSEFLSLAFGGHEAREARSAADAVPVAGNGLSAELAAQSADSEIRERAGVLTAGHVLVDLRDQTPGTGIACDTFDGIERVGEDLLFDVRLPDASSSDGDRWSWLPWRKRSR